jgi:hypothetical protein
MLKLFLLVAIVAVTINGESVISITTGTGFNSCTGYCYNSVQINASTIVVLKTSKTNPTENPAIQQYYSSDSSTFDELVELVGNIQIWKTVDSPIGCPDCNNQGLEWIDVYTDEQPKYGVTFEYNSTIPGFESLVSSLRAIRQEYF